jgi:hypothetical protein
VSAQPKPLEELIKELPLPLRAEVRDFVEFLLAKRARTQRNGDKLRQDWANKVPTSNEMTSVELQHAALDWRD